MIQVCARRACVRVFVRAGEDDESAISARRETVCVDHDSGIGRDNDGRSMLDVVYRCK